MMNRKCVKFKALRVAEVQIKPIIKAILWLGRNLSVKFRRIEGFYILSCKHAQIL